MGIDVLKPSIQSKPRLRVRFGLTIKKYDFASPPYKLEVNGKAIHGKTMGQKNRRN